MSEANCGNCRFWKRGYGPSGICRRHAPRPIAPELGYWAETEETEWCGEHQPIKATKTEPDTEKKPARYREPTNEDIGREVEMRDGEGKLVDYWTKAKLVCVLDDAIEEGRFVADWDGDYFVFEEARILCGGEGEE